VIKSQADLIAQRIAAFAEVCRRHGVPLTVQRRAVLEAVLERSDHPTADQVFDVVRARLPGISRTTVYRVLDTLVGLGMIGRAHHQGSVARFDAKTHRHHHLVCEACRRVVDYEAPGLDALPLPEPAATGFEIRDYSVQFTGLCAACRASAAKQPASAD
jgi:Fur family transcriptional regulator, peroxide stress response regulator